MRTGAGKKLDSPAAMGMSVPMRVFPIICLPLLLGLSGCSYLADLAVKKGMFDKHLKRTNRTGKAKLIGTIELVNPEQNYVLINCDQRQNLPPGTEIIAQSPDGSKAKLKVTPERKGNYITADITEGEPRVRDLVLQQVRPGDMLPGEAVPATPAAPEGPPVNLTPIMPADVIPPLGTPFQSIGAPTQVAPAPAATLPPLRPAAPIPLEEPAPAPAPDKLPPVIR